MSKKKEKHSETNYIFNDLSNFKYWYPIIREIARGNGDIKKFRELTLDSPFFDNKVITKLKNKMEKEELEDGVERNFDDYIIKYIDKILKNVTDWSELIYYDNDNEKYIIREQYNEILNKDINIMKFRYHLFKHLRKLIGGDYQLKKRNTSFFLFLSFFIETEVKKIWIDNTKPETDRYLKLISDFKNYLQQHDFYFYRQDNKDLDWNYKKIGNILRLFEDLSLLHRFKDHYYLFGDKSYFHFFINQLLACAIKNKYQSSKVTDEVLLELTDLLKFLHNDLIYLPALTHTMDKLPFFLEQMLNYAKKKGLITIHKKGDADPYELKNGDKIRYLLIQTKELNYDCI